MTGHFNKGLKGKQESSTGPSFALRINLSKKNFLEQNLEEDDRRKSQAGGGGGGGHFAFRDMSCNYSAQFVNGSHSKLHFYNRKSVICRHDLGILDSHVNIKLRKKKQDV